MFLLVVHYNTGQIHISKIRNWRKMQQTSKLAINIFIDRILTFKKRHLKLSTPTHNYKFQRDDKIGRVMETFWYHARLILCPGLITLIPIVSKAFRQLLIPIECQDNSTIPLPPPLSHPMIFYWNNIDFWHLKTSHSSDTVTKLDTWWKLNLVSLQS